MTGFPNAPHAHTHYCGCPAKPAEAPPPQPSGGTGLVWRRVFPGRADQCPRVRRFVRLLLEDDPCRDDAELIVAELVGNALRHTLSGTSQGGCFLVEVVRDDGVLISVQDAGGTGFPDFGRHPHTDQENGRGLATVAALATRTGYHGHPETGHTVWAHLASPSAQELGVDRS